jgi:hypothetical protein
VIPWAGAVLAAIVLVVSGWRVRQGWRSRRWPRLEATVVSSWPEPVLDGETGSVTQYRQVVTWTFSLRGKPYSGSARSGPVGTQPRSVKRIGAAFRAGARVWVYYDPRRPSRSVLEPGVSESDAAVCALSALALGWLLRMLLG